MTIKHQIELETISFIFIAAFLSVFLVWRSNQSFQQQFHLAVPFVAENKTETVVTPISDKVLKIDIATQTSPDGTKKLIMKTTHNFDGTLTYVFSVTDKSAESKQVLYTERVKGSESMSIPFNTFSPDNKYLFIQKNGSNALVFKATGESVAADQEYFDVSGLFGEKIKQHIFSQATGWASPTLLVINTVTQNGTKGSSYWFEVPSKAILQLASEF